MISVLPLESLREEDVQLVGEQVFALAKLKQQGLPVPQGFVVAPPEFHLKTVLEHFDYKHKEVFEQSLEIIKKEVAAIPVPDYLLEAALPKNFPVQDVWKRLLSDWLETIRSSIWREGFADPFKNLRFLPILTTGKVQSFGTIYYNYTLTKPYLKISEGELTSEQEETLNQLVKQADRLLFLPFVYQWIVVDGEVLIVKVIPFTQEESLPEEVKVENVTSDLKIHQPLLQKSAVKVFLELSTDLAIHHEVDGFLITSNEVHANGYGLTDKDFKMLQLVEAAHSQPNQPVIYLLADRQGQPSSVRGALHLLHSPTLLKDEVEVFQFARNKKDLLNVNLGIPFVRSSYEYQELKKELAVLGIHRKGSLQFWLELAVPENFINIDTYLDVGVDGVIVNVDMLSAQLNGFSSFDEYKSFHGNINALTSFLEEGLKKIHQAKIPILIRGNFAFHDELLTFLIKKGVWAVCIDSPHREGARDYITLIEKNTVGDLPI